MMLKNNTEFIIPLVLNKLHIRTANLRNAWIEELGKNKFLVIQAENCFINEDFLVKQEPNFYNMFYAGKTVKIRYSIPEYLWSTCSIIKNTGYDGLTKDQLFDCICFWKKNAFDFLVNEKTQAARESSLGFIFLIVLDSHNLILIISTFIFTTVNLFVCIMIRYK